MESSWPYTKFIGSSTDAASMLYPVVKGLFQGRPVSGEDAFWSEGARHLGG